MSAQINYKSECCNAPVTIEHGCDSDLGHSGKKCDCAERGGVTMWYECSKCHQPCDVFSKSKDKKEEWKDDWRVDLDNVFEDPIDETEEKMTLDDIYFERAYQFGLRFISNLLQKERQEAYTQGYKEGSGNIAADVIKLKEQYDKGYKESLSEAIKIFEKHKEEPMTANVVLLELKALRGDYERKS